MTVLAGFCHLCKPYCVVLFVSMIVWNAISCEMVSAKLVFGSTNNLSGHVGGSQHLNGSASPAAYDIDFNGNRRWPNTDDDDDKLSDYTNEENQDSGEHVWIDLSKLGSVFSHEGSSLYLRMGELSELSPYTQLRYMVSTVGSWIVLYGIHGGIMDCVIWYP